MLKKYSHRLYIHKQYIWRRWWGSLRFHFAHLSRRGNSLPRATGSVRCPFSPLLFPFFVFPFLINYKKLAEMVGFEPTYQLPDKRISSASRYDHFGTSPLHLENFSIIQLKKQLFFKIHFEFLIGLMYN